MATSRSTLVENILGAAKFYYSRFFHVFENCFGPPGAGEFRFEQFPRTLIRSICCALGPYTVKRIIPQRWIQRSEQMTASTIKHSPSIKHWLPLQVANFTTWPRYVPTARYPPPPTTVSGTSCRITYYGHSSVFIQTQDSNVIVDPIFGTRCGPRYVMGKVEVMGTGIRRVKQPAWDLDDPTAPPLHLILVTHDHYDSFDKAGVKTLLRWSGPTLCGGRGMSRHIWSKEGPSVYFMDWYDSIKYDLLKIQFLPAVHSSGRSQFLDRNGVLWGSYLIASHDLTIFHAGGTGYSEHFKRIAENVRNLDRKIDLAILPVGHYEVGGLQNMYMTPEEAVQAFQDLDARKALAVHHDTFPLGVEKFGQPRRDLLEALHRQHLSPLDFFVLEPGQHFYLHGSPAASEDDALSRIGRIEGLDDWAYQVAWAEQASKQ